MRVIPTGARSPSYVHSVVSYPSAFVFVTFDGSPCSVLTPAVVDSPGVMVPHPAAAAPNANRARRATSAALMPGSRAAGPPPATPGGRHADPTARAPRHR